jgi:glycerol-3-phosphate dehydrogenase
LGRDAFASRPFAHVPIENGRKIVHFSHMKISLRSGKIIVSIRKGAVFMYEIGQQVLYGIHGVCRIISVESMRFGKERAKYYVLEPAAQPGARFYVPVANEAAVAKLHPLLTREELLEYEPSVPNWSIGGLYMGTGGITCPHKMTIALAENAAENGAEIALNTAVLSMKTENGIITEVVTNRGTIYPRAVINAAGVYADVIADMAGDRTFTIHPRVGTDLITDKKAGWMVSSSLGKTPFTLSPKQLEEIPDDPVSRVKAILKNMHSHSKGIGLIHAADGNALIGPNADEVPDREDTSTDREICEHVISAQQEVQPAIRKSDIIAYFTGVRSPTYEEDFVVRKGIFTKNIFEAAGIQSPGLTAAPAIAADIAMWVREYLETFMDVKEDPSFDPKRKYKPVLSELTFEERNELIREHPDYGEIICRCECISKGEILDALRSPVPVYTTDAIKRRVRCGMGRCQGGFCLPRIIEIIAEETGEQPEEIVKASSESTHIFRKTK